MIDRMVLLGASGDLTSRQLMPAVGSLVEAGLLPQPFSIVGSATSDWSSEEFREHIAAALKEHSTVTPATRDVVVRMLSFQPADVTQQEDVRRLIGPVTRTRSCILRCPRVCCRQSCRPWQ